jgi:hypothetical protein
MAKAKLKSYHVLYLDFLEEHIRASSVKMTAKLVSFYRDEKLVLAVPVSEFRRIGETKFTEELAENPKLEALRAKIAKLKTDKP